MTEKMQVGEIRYSALPMEYPPTSPEGIAVVYKKTKTRTSTKSNQASRSQPETKKTKVIDLTEDNVDFDMEERQLSLKERQLEIEERELKIESERNFEN